MQGPQ